MIGSAGARRRTLRVALGAVAGLLCAVAALVASPTAHADTPPELGVEASACPVEIPAAHAHRVECGVLTVPERRDAGADPARVIELPYAVIASTAASPAADPLVFPTAGGPGSSSLGTLGYWLDWAEWATSERDVIVIEQRGDAVSTPSLDCPELDTAELVVDGVLHDTDRAVRDAQVQACHDRLVEAGADLSAYTSAASAADLADLRTALGYDAWNLYGLSYGARLALTTMRDQPAGLRAVILDGPYPPHVDSFADRPLGYVGAVDALLTACAGAADCAEQYPDLEESLFAVLERAAREPYLVPVQDPEGGPSFTVEVDDGVITNGLFQALYDPWTIRALPFAIDQLAAGDTDVLLPLAQQNVDQSDIGTDGLRLSVECAEEVPFHDPARLAANLGTDPLLGHYQDAELLPQDCAVWAVPPTSPAENEPVVSSIPTLVATGGYDPVTPRSYGEAAVASLSGGSLAFFPTMGHGPVWLTWIDPCPSTMAAAFLRDPSAAPDASCVAAMPPTDFLTIADVDPTSAVYRLSRDVLAGPDPLRAGSGVLILALLVATLVYGIGYGLAWLVRREGTAPTGAVLAATLAAAFDLAFVAGLAAILATTEPLVLAFGLPPAAWPLLLLPFAGLAGGILLTARVVHAWIVQDGSTGHLVMLSIAAVASLSFAVWLLVHGLLTL